MKPACCQNPGVGQARGQSASGLGQRLKTARYSHLGPAMTPLGASPLAVWKGDQASTRGCTHTLLTISKGGTHCMGFTANHCLHATLLIHVVTKSNFQPQLQRSLQQHLPPLLAWLWFVCSSVISRSNPHINPSQACKLSFSQHPNANVYQFYKLVAITGLYALTPAGTRGKFNLP